MNKNKIENLKKNNKGVVTAFVLISMLFFILIGSAIYTSVSNNKLAIIEDVYDIESQYYVTDTSLLQAYEEIID